jgi:hypothetical protein
MITPEQAVGGSLYLLLLFPTINIVIIDQTPHTASAASDCHNASASFSKLIFCIVIYASDKLMS